MSFMIVAGVVALALFALAYVRPGKYGIAALALVAGNALALFWADYLASTYKYVGDKLGIAPWHELLYAALVLVPVLLVLLFGKKGHEKVPRLLGAIVLAALAVTLLLPVFAVTTIVDPGSRSIYDFVSHWQTLFVTGAIVLALVDVVFGGTLKSHGHDKD